MSNIQTFRAGARSRVYLATLIGALGVASCGGGSNEAGTAGTGNVAVKPNAAAITSLTASPSTLTSSGVSTIKWTSTLAKSCTLSVGGSGITVGVNDSYTTPTLNSTATYTLTCVGTYGGSASKSVQILVSATTPTTTTTTPTTTTTTPPPTTTTTPPPTTTTMASVAAACATEPRLSGTVHYYCDCGTGAQSGCVTGNDGNPGTDPLLPRRTIGNAATLLKSQAAVNDTVALCKGGAFNATGTLNIGSTRCATGTTCNDLREYTPTTFSGTAKPIINNVAGTVPLILIDGNIGGLRLLNLTLHGDYGAPDNRNRGIFFYEGAHDVTMCNVDMDGFDVSVYNESDAGINTNIKLTGSHITNSRSMGYLGSGNNTEISYNNWDGSGSSTVFDHTLYISSHRPVSNVQIVGNHIHGQYGSTCLGNPINVQGEFDGLAVDGNEVNIDRSAATGGCWGISLANGGYVIPVYFRHASVSGNTIRNGGNQALSIENCPGCVIENNLIIQDWSYGSGAWSLAGIVAPGEPYRAGDDVNTANVIRNNTIYFGPTATGGGTGITVKTQGTDHVIANNTVYYSAASVGQGVNCFSYPLALGSYAFINNNHCYSTAAYSWVAGRGTLAAWRTYAAAPGFDTASIIGNTLFNAVGADFTPAVGSPLIGKGDAAHGAAYDQTGKVRPSPPAIGAYER